MTVKGIDVASYQSETYSTSGLAFVFVKATESTTYVNPKHAAQVARARAAGLTVGHYHFQRAGSATAQAAYFLAHAGAKAGDILACDWEDTGVSCADKDAFIKAVQKSKPGLRVVLYCNRDFWLHRDTTSFCGDGLWIADPSAKAGAPRVEHAWMFHQYGISGTDVNVANFASTAALKAWTNKTTPVGATTTTTTTKGAAVAETQIVDGPLTGVIGTTDKGTPSGRVEHRWGFFLASLLDQAQQQTALLTEIAAAVKADKTA